MYLFIRNWLPLIYFCTFLSFEVGVTVQNDQKCANKP